MPVLSLLIKTPDKSLRIMEAISLFYDFLLPFIANHLYNSVKENYTYCIDGLQITLHLRGEFMNELFSLRNYYNLKMTPLPL